MVTGWADLLRSATAKPTEFVSVDARYDVKNDHSSYEMLSKDQSGVVTSLPPVQLSSPTSPQPHRSPSQSQSQSQSPLRSKSPEYFGQTARYQPPARSFSSPRPPTSPTGWDSETSYARPMQAQGGYQGYQNGHGRGPSAGSYQSYQYGHGRGPSAAGSYKAYQNGHGRGPSVGSGYEGGGNGGNGDMNPLGMNRI